MNRLSFLRKQNMRDTLQPLFMGEVVAYIFQMQSETYTRLRTFATSSFTSNGFVI